MHLRTAKMEPSHAPHLRMMAMMASRRGVMAHRERQEGVDGLALVVGVMNHGSRIAAARIPVDPGKLRARIHDGGELVPRLDPAVEVLGVTIISGLMYPRSQAGSGTAEIGAVTCTMMNDLSHFVVTVDSDDCILPVMISASVEGLEQCPTNTTEADTEHSESLGLAAELMQLLTVAPHDLRSIGLL